MTHYILAGSTPVKHYFKNEFNEMVQSINSGDGTIISYTQQENNLSLLLDMLNGWHDFILLSQSDIEKIKNETDLEIEITIQPSEVENAKNVLKNNGYFVDNLWQVDDVKSKYKCTDEEAMEVLNGALTNDATMEQVWLAIDIHAEIDKLPKYNPDLFLINGFYKDDKTKFSDYLVYAYDCAPEDEDINEDDIFFYGLSEDDIQEAIASGWETSHDFVITSYEKATT